MLEGWTSHSSRWVIHLGRQKLHRRLTALSVPTLMSKTTWGELSRTVAMIRF